MVGFIIIGFLFILSLTFIGVRLSIGLMFWISKKPKNAMHVFKMHFPYYIIILGIICAFAIVTSAFNIGVIVYYGAVYVMALGIWKFLLTKSQKTKTLQIEGTSSSK
jgi:hypothetical protein